MSSVFQTGSRFFEPIRGTASFRGAILAGADLAGLHQPAGIDQVRLCTHHAGPPLEGLGGAGDSKRRFRCRGSALALHADNGDALPGLQRAGIRQRQEHHHSQAVGAFFPDLIAERNWTDLQGRVLIASLIDALKRPDGSYYGKFRKPDGSEFEYDVLKLSKPDRALIKQALVKEGRIQE